MGMKAMEFTEMDRLDPRIDRMLRDDRYFLQQKLDGIRLIATLHNDEIQFLNRRGEEMKSTTVLQHLPSITREVWDVLDRLRTRYGFPVAIDGEMMPDGTYNLFDTDMKLDYLNRLMALRGATHAEERHHLRVVATMVDEMAKRWLLDRLEELGYEGAIFRFNQEHYRSGQRPDRQVKVKFVKTADLVVLGAQREFKGDSTVVKMGSAQLGAFKDGTKMTQVCSASLIGKDLTIKEGDVVEVAYLYFTGSGLIQPRIVKKRTDKLPTDCTFQQFPTYRRSVYMT